jgi:hypothetical protein
MNPVQGGGDGTPGNVTFPAGESTYNAYIITGTVPKVAAQMDCPSTMGIRYRQSLPGHSLEPQSPPHPERLQIPGGFHDFAVGDAHPFWCLKNSTCRNRFNASAFVLYGPPRFRPVVFDPTS